MGNPLRSGAIFALTVLLAPACSSSGSDAVVTGSSSSTTSVSVPPTSTAAPSLVATPVTQTPPPQGTSLRSFDGEAFDDVNAVGASYIWIPTEPNQAPTTCEWVLVTATADQRQAVDIVGLGFPLGTRCAPEVLAGRDDWAFIDRPIGEGGGIALPDTGEELANEDVIAEFEVLRNRPVVVAAGREELLALLPQAREQWNANGSAEYTIDVTPACFCGLPNMVASVRDELVVDLESEFEIPEAELPTEWLTVSALFDYLDRWTDPPNPTRPRLRDPAGPVVVLFDAETGVPLDLWGDFTLNAIDDELELHIDYDFEEQG